ncbi:MAG: ABC-F family ATP-binding cassette domain-containing protein [Candidatus Thermoplasmatota archaeon]
MARPLVQAEGLTKAFGGRALFDNAQFQVEEGERVALVGRNGAGKTTLLNLVAGRESPDHGSVRVWPHAKLIVFTQHQEFTPGATAREVLAAGSEAPPELMAELRALEERIADPALYESGESDGVLARYGEVQREVQLAKSASAAASDASPLVEELGFTDADLDRKVASLSGGERTRLFLARTLAQADPRSLLILDEPTNHLDVETIEWLEEWLTTHEGTVLMVAHDRAFLDNVTTRVLAIEEGKVASYPGNYEEFERVRTEDATRLAARRAREQRELDRQKAVIEQFKHQKRFNGQMASRLTSLEKYRAAIDKTPDPLMEKVQMALGFPESFKSSNDCIRVRGLGKKFGDRLLFYDLNLDINKGDRVGLVGANGAGKTTLLRVLTGREKKDVGNIEIAPGVRGCYYAQGAEGLDVKRTLREELAAARPGIAEEDTRALLGRFGFRGEGDLARKVQTLSGGERARLALLKTILTPSNLLILDEPTNHLDLQSREALAGALNAYKGTLLVVSHDRWLMDSVINKVAVLGRGQVKVFAGDFTTAREAAAMEGFSTEKPTTYVVKKGFRDYDDNVRHAVGARLMLTEAELDGKRLYRTALSMGWMEAE